DCPTNWSCQDGLCIGGADCVKTICTAGMSHYCGVLGDGCGGQLDCGACEGGNTCGQGGGVAAHCGPLQCDSPGARVCGPVGDGCGGTLDCGACPGGGMCGGGGIPNICPGPNCTPAGCTPMSGAIYCGGVVGDGCGGAVTCGDCPNGGVCGGSGT